MEGQSLALSRRVEPVRFRGPEGELEGLWSDPGQPDPGPPPAETPPGTAIPAAVICHPHPAHRGSMHSKVVHTVYRVLEASGHPTLRFNFRGVGASQGAYSGRDGEVGDLAAAVSYARGRTGRSRLWVAGFSFGSWIALRYALGDPDVAQVIALGLPVTANIDGRRFDFIDRVPWPLLLVQGDRDRYGSAEDIRTFHARLSSLGRAGLRIVPDADHFFTGRIEPLRHALEDGLAALAAGGA
jgi:alpha/beta superfamily hydrolase